MMKVPFLAGIVIALVGGCILPGCGIDRSATLNPPILGGEYTGAVERGPAVSFSFEQGRGGLVGRGRIGEQDVLVLQDTRSSIPGRLVFSNGTVVPTTLKAEFKGNLSLLLPGGSRTLVPSTELELPPLGPYTGFFEAKDIAW